MSTAPGTLYLVPNTLDHGVTSGAPALTNLLPTQVMRIAAGLAYWVVENAKSARVFLKRVDAQVPLACPLQQIRIVELPRPAKGTRSAPEPDLRALLAPLHAGHDLGLLSEAGMPAVADPGAALVAAAHADGLVVEPLVGPSSLLMALAASGLNGQSFAFVGYLPVDAAQRAARLGELEALSRRARQTQLMIETPYRNAALFEALLSTLAADTRVSVACGLTLEGGWNRTDRVAGWRRQRAPLPANMPAVFGLLAG